MEKPFKMFLQTLKYEFLYYVYILEGGLLELKNFYSIFDGLKILLWMERFESLSKQEIPKPVCCHVEAMNQVSLQTVSNDDLLWLADACKNIGLSSVYFSADVDFFPHPASGMFMSRLKENNIEVCMITNGVHVDQFFDDIMHSCKMIVVNVDAATPETYSSFKNREKMDFFKIITNIQKIIRMKQTGPEIVFKFLTHPMNYEEIYDAVVLAKSLGVDGIQIRPCYSKDVTWYQNMVREIAEEGRRAVELSNNDFYVNITIPFADNEKIMKKCERCEISPLAGLTFSADGNVYVCSDLKDRDESRLCSWKEIEQVYGSEKHKQVLASIDTKNCPLQCKDEAYQDIYEKIIKEDLLNYKFI